MMRNRPRGGGGKVGGGAGLLGEGPGTSTGMKIMMSGGGDGGLLGKGPNQGRMAHQANQVRVPPHHDRMPQRPNQDRMHQPPRPPRALLGTPGIEESHMRPGGRPDHAQERQAYGGGGHLSEREYYEEPEQPRGYIEEDHYAHQRYEDPGTLYDHQQEVPVDHYAGHEPEMDYGGRPPAGRMNAGRAPLVGRAPNDHQQERHWDPPRSQPDQRELMQKAADQVRMQRSPRSLLDAPYERNREPQGRRVDQPGPREREMQAFAEERRHMDEFYDEPKRAGGYIEEDPYAQGYEPQRSLMDSDRGQMNPRNERERRSRFEPLRPQPNVQKTKQRELMEKADLQMKLLEEEKRIEQEQRERMAMLQQQQALILQQQQQQQMHMQQQQMQQQKMQLMHQQAGILGNVPGMGSSQGGMGAIPSIFDLPTGSKAVLGKRPAAMSRDDNKKLRRGPGDRWERTRSLSGNRDKKPLPSATRRDLPRNRRDRASELRSKAVRGGNNRRGDRKNSAPATARSRGGQGRDKDRNSRNSGSSNRERSSSSRSSRSVKSKEGSVDKSKDKKAETASGKDKKSEEYDPAEPTGEVLTDKSTDDGTNDVNVKVEADDGKDKEGEKGDKSEKKDAEISLTVTVNKKGRSVNDSDKKDDGNKDSPSKTKKYKCNVCSIDCYDEESFARHMNGKKHREKMELVMSSTSHQEVLIKSRLQAEEHLRQIEGSNKGPATKPAPKPVPKGKALETHCKVCDKKFTGAYKDHKDSTDHKAKEDRSKAGCKICNVTTFNTYHDYQKHLQSDWHKKNRRKLQKDDEDEELSELVTLDTVGFEDDSTGEQNKNTQDNENSKSSVFRKPLPVSTSSPKVTRSASIEDEVEVLGVFDPKIAVGKKYIVPVAGYFCKVCHKFYNNETAAKVTHCQSKSHYDRLQKHIEAKKQKDAQSASANSSESQSDSGKTTEKNALNTSQSQNGDTSINDESLETSQESNTEDQADTTMGDGDSATEKDDSVSMETDTSLNNSESDLPTVQIEVSDKPAVTAKPSPKGKQQQKARRGGAGRGRGAKKY